MFEEHVVAFAQGAEAGFPGIRPVEPVFRALPVACEEVPAIAAFAGQCVALVYAEFHLRGRGHHIPQA